MSKAEQLNYKFILCPEVNDVATALKWVMSSNSIAVMPKPSCETWFIEGVLKPNEHYIEVKEDYSDLEEKVDYYSSNTKEAEWILENAHNHVKQFQDPVLEEIILIKVLEKYFTLSTPELKCVLRY